MRRGGAALTPEAPAPRGGGPSAYAILALAIALHALLVWRTGGHWRDLDHDSTISVLAATGHEAAWARLPLGAWIRARDVQRLFAVDEAWPLRRIRDDLAGWDIHPPLYFWLLHGQLLASRVSPSSFFVLNLLVGALTIVALFALGRRGWDAGTGAGAALLWSVSAGVLLTAATARPYALGALLAVLLVRLAVAEPPDSRPGRLAWWTATSLAMGLGLLTLYSFAIVIAGVVAGSLLAERGGGRRAIALVAAGAAGLGLLFVVHPHFAESLARQRAQAQPFGLPDLPWRIRRFALGLEGLVPPGLGPPWLAAASGLLLLAAAVRAVSRGLPGRLASAAALFRAASPAARRLAWITATIAGIEALFYLAHVSPAHAAGDRYNAALWPLLALLFAAGARALTGDRLTVPLVAAAAFPLTWSLVSSLDAGQRALPSSPEWRALSAARVVVSDHPHRGVLPRAILLVPPGTPLWIVDRGSDPAALVAELRAGGAPVTFLLHPDLGDPRVREALTRAVSPGDSFSSVGTTTAGAEILVWKPARQGVTAPSRMAGRAQRGATAR